MKNKLVALGLVSVMALSLVACGDKEAETEETTAETEEETADTTEEAAETEEETSDEDLDCTYDWADYVTLGDYMGVEVTLDGDYDYSDEGLADYIADQVSSAVGYIEDDTQTTIAEDSIVNVDYVGSQDGVAFDGGSAEDQTLDIAANGDVDGNSYIDGFTEGLIGHEVGEEVAYEVTFPDSYGNEDLAGQTVTFTFQVNYIAKEATVDDLNDDNIADYFSEYSTMADFQTGMEEEYKQSLEDALEQDTEDAVVETIYGNATVTGCPENLLTVRMNKYIDMMESYLGGYSLEEYVTAYGMDYDEYLSQMKESLSDAIKQQMVFEAIAAAENLEIDQDEYDEYVEQVMSYNNVTDEDTFYDNYTVGNLNGKDYFNTIYLADKAMELCVDNAVVNR